MQIETALTLGALLAALYIEKEKRTPSDNGGINDYEDGVVEGLNIAIAELNKLKPCNCDKFERK